MQICEDVPQVLDSDVPGLPDRPIKIFLPRFFYVRLDLSCSRNSDGDSVFIFFFLSNYSCGCSLLLN